MNERPSLTELTIKLLWELYRHKRNNWNSPTYRELAEIIGVRSTSHVHRHIGRLKSTGLLHSDSSDNLGFDRDKVEKFLREAGYDLSSN